MGKKVRQVKTGTLGRKKNGESLSYSLMDHGTTVWGTGRGDAQIEKDRIKKNKKYQ